MIARYLRFVDIQIDNRSSSILCTSFSFLYPQTKECTDTPFGVINREFLLITNVGVVVHHRSPQELVAPMVQHSPSACNDDFGEVVVHGHAVIANGQRSLAVDDEGRQRRDVKQPAP